MPDVAINAQQVQQAGQGYTVPDSLALLLKNVRASYNGTSAAGSFVPVLRIVSDAGLTVGEYRVSGSLAAGASADVTWFPGHVEDGIQFDTYPQAGHTLYAETDGPGTPGGIGPGGRYPASLGELDLVSLGGSGVLIYEGASGGVCIVSESLPTNPAPSYVIGGGGIQIEEGIGGITLEGKTSGSWSQDGTLDLSSGSTATVNGTAAVTLVAPTVNAQLSQLVIATLPTSDPASANHVWADNGVLVLSGHTVPSGGINFGSNTGTSLTITTTTGGVVLQLANSQHFRVNDNGGNALIDQQEDGALVVNLVAGQSLTVKDSGGTTIFQVDEAGAGPFFQLGTGGELDVYDHNGNLIMKLDEATGDLHLLTGASVISDL